MQYKYYILWYSIQCKMYAFVYSPINNLCVLYSAYILNNEKIPEAKRKNRYIFSHKVRRTSLVTLTLIRAAGGVYDFRNFEQV